MGHSKREEDEKIVQLFETNTFLMTLSLGREKEARGGVIYELFFVTFSNWWRTASPPLILPIIHLVIRGRHSGTYVERRRGIVSPDLGGFCHEIRKERDVFSERASRLGIDHCQYR